MSKFNELYESTMQTFDATRIRPQSIVVIDGDALKIKEIHTDIMRRKGPQFIAQLAKMANDGQLLYVSAMKTTRSVSHTYAVNPGSDLLEADVINYVPGLIGVWGGSLTLPVSILKVAVPPEMIMQIPTDKHEHKLGKEEGDNSYNDGKQHPNTVGQKSSKKKK